MGETSSFLTGWRCTGLPRPPAPTLSSRSRPWL